MYPKLIKSNIKLTIGMLVSNHVHMIRKCMESIKPLLDAVPSELVILDTKGEETDGSINIVREYTDKIYRFEWCNDFSAARNTLLDHANGEWFLYFDDDEYFDNVQEFIDFFQSGECEKYYTGFYYTRDYSADGTYSMGIAGRMIRRTVNTRFVGKVHETFNEVYAPNKVFSCFTHHYGYVYSDDEAKKKHQDRNLSILREELKEQGYTPRICAQMAQELLAVEDTREEGFRFCVEAIEKLKAAGELADSSSQWVAVASVRYFSATEEHQKLLEQARYILNNYPLNQIAKLALAATVVLSGIKASDADAVLEYAPMYLENWDWSNANPEEALLQTQMDFPKFMEENYYLEIVRVAAVSANYVKDYRTANQYWKRIPWNKEGFDASKYVADMSRTMQGLKELQEKQKQSAKLREIISLLDSVQEADEYLRTVITTGNRQEQQNMLAGMQEAAITVGTSLDQLLGEGTKEVSLLEKYCELVWQCNNETEALPKNTIADKMAKTITKVKECLQQRIG